MKIKNKDLKVEMLDNFVYATMEINKYTEVPPNLNADTILDLRLELENEADIVDVDSKINILNVLTNINSNVPEDTLRAEDKMRLRADLVLLQELKNEIMVQAQERTLMSM